MLAALLLAAVSPALAVSWHERLDVLPDVQTYAEAGHADLNDPSWFGLVAPKSTPPEQIARVQEAREPLAVSFSHTTAAILLPKALPVMARDMDGFDFAVHVMNSDAILEQASMKAVQLGVVEKPIVNDSVDRVTLCEDRLVLAGEPDGVWMVREHGSGVRYYTDLYFKTAQVVPARTMEVSSNAAIVAALSAGFGQSLISEAAVPAGVPVQRELGDEFVRRFYALVPRSGLTHDQRELAETIIAALRG